MKMDIQINQYTQNQINQMNAQFHAAQRANAQRQAAFDSYNRAYWERSNREFEANRARSQAQFDSYRPDYSEAIRGVNTYVDDYGKEYEVSVRADNAYIRNGDVIGVEGYETPGVDWTKLNRK